MFAKVVWLCVSVGKSALAVLRRRDVREILKFDLVSHFCDVLIIIIINFSKTNYNYDVNLINQASKLHFNKHSSLFYLKLEKFL